MHVLISTKMRRNFLKLSLVELTYVAFVCTTWISTHTDALGSTASASIAADESLDAQPRIGDAAQCTLLFTPCVDRRRAGTHSGNAVPAETYPQM